MVANGCRDATAEVARGFATQAEAAGWGLLVLELPQGSKPGALNAGDAVAKATLRAYLDADVVVSPGLMAELSRSTCGGCTALRHRNRPNPACKKCRHPRLCPLLATPALRAKSGPRLWSVRHQRRQDVRAGATFPGIISDDTFVRLQFEPHERVQVAATYQWPMIEGFAALTKVRRRQDAGVAEIDRLYPGLAGA